MLKKFVKVASVSVVAAVIASVGLGLYLENNNNQKKNKSKDLNREKGDRPEVYDYSRETTDVKRFYSYCKVRPGVNPTDFSKEKKNLIWEVILDDSSTPVPNFTIKYQDEETSKDVTVKLYVKYFTFEYDEQNGQNGENIYTLNIVCANAEVKDDEGEIWIVLNCNEKKNKPNPMIEKFLTDMSDTNTEIDVNLFELIPDGDIKYFELGFTSVFRDVTIVKYYSTNDVVISKNQSERWKERWGQFK